MVGPVDHVEPIIGLKSTAMNHKWTKLAVAARARKIKIFERPCESSNRCKTSRDESREDLISEHPLEPLKRKVSEHISPAHLRSRAALLPINFNSN